MNVFITFVNTAKRILPVDWKTVDGAGTRKRVLHLQADADGISIFPMKGCLIVGFKSRRVLREHPLFQYALK